MSWPLNGANQPQQCCPPAQRIGLTNPYTPHAAHPVRFQQRNRNLTALAVTNPNDPGGVESLASIAANEHARRQAFVNASQATTNCLKNAIITLNSAQANVLKADKQSAFGQNNNDGAFAFTVPFAEPISCVLSNRFVYGQLRSWEIALQARCIRDPQSALSLVNAPVNHEPLIGEEDYSLPISELYNVTCDRRALNLPLSGSRCPPILLPLTLTRIERVVAFHWQRTSDSVRQLAASGGCDDDIDSSCKALPLYAFRTTEEHGYAPGLRFTLVLPSKVDDDCYEPDNADEFVVVQSAEHDPREFVALRCKRRLCSARLARVFDPWDTNGSECRKYGCDDTAPWIDAPVPNAALVFLQQGQRQSAKKPTKKSRNSQSAECNLDNFDEPCLHPSGVFWACDYAENGVLAFSYVSPATTPLQLTSFVNGTIRAQHYFGNDFFNEAGVHVLYDITIDQYIVINGLGERTYVRSLLGDETGSSATALNFPLQRSAMVASECALEYKQTYLERVLNGFHYFRVIKGHNDRFFVRLEHESEESAPWVAVTVPPACYPARLFVLALQKALDDAFDCKIKFVVEHRVFNTQSLLKARQIFQSQSGNWRKTTQPLPTPNAGPYADLTFAITIEADCVFSLAFGKDDCSAQFANLIDFEPRAIYELASIYTSRPLSLDCADERIVRKWLGNATDQCCAHASVCPRRQYEARVEPSQGMVTLQQRVQRPFRVLRSDFCDGVLRVKIEPRADCGTEADVFFCEGDILIASRHNPLSSSACCDEEVLVAIVGEHSVDQFDVSHDPFPECDQFWLWSMPVGFNLHLHPREPAANSTLNYADKEKSAIEQTASQANALTRYLGFFDPSTKIGSFCYTSDQVPGSIIDESVLVQIPELLPLATSESRDTLFSPDSPFDQAMTQYYAQLLLDRGTGVYRAYPATVAPLPEPSAPRDVLPAAGAPGVTWPNKISVQLFRPDGSVYNLHANPFVVAFELVFTRQ